MFWYHPSNCTCEQVCVDIYNMYIHTLICIYIYVQVFKNKVVCDMYYSPTWFYFPYNLLFVFLTYNIFWPPLKARTFAATFLFNSRISSLKGIQERGNTTLKMLCKITEN